MSNTPFADAAEARAIAAIGELETRLREIAAKLLITADELESGKCHPIKAANRLRKIVRENFGNPATSFDDVVKAATYLPHGIAGTLKSSMWSACEFCKNHPCSCPTDELV